MRQIFLDTETTGLSAADGDRIVEVGCIELDNRRLSGRTLHHYLNPERPNHEDAVKVHGLTDEFLADKPLFASVADELLAYLAGSVACIALLAHYLRHVLGGWRPALGMGGLLVALYGVLYGILVSEDNALMMGSLLLFGVLAAVMVATRKLDWYNVMGSNVAPAAAGFETTRS